MVADCVAGRTAGDTADCRTGERRAYGSTYDRSAGSTDAATYEGAFLTSR